MRMCRLPIALVVLVWGWALPTPLVSGGAPAAAQDMDWQGLPPGPGREETFNLCGACHSLKLVTQQGLPRDRWDELMDYMVDEQGMPPLEPAERKLIVDYLAEFYGPDRKARGGKL